MKVAPRNDAERLSLLIREAARQRLFMSGWLSDKEFVKNGGEVIYAVDTDVVTLFVNSKEVALPKGQREGYGRIFHTDTDEMMLGTGLALADFIFNQSSKSKPHSVILLPSVQKEMATIFKAISIEAEHAQNLLSEQLAAVEQNRAEFEATVTDEDKLELLESIAPQVVKVIAGFDNSFVFLKKFALLFADKNINQLNNFILQTSDTQLKAALSQPKEITAQVTLSTLKRDWSKRLAEFKSASGFKDLMGNDAEVLSRIEFVNRQIGNLGAGDRFRVVFVTGDASIHEAGDFQIGSTSLELQTFAHAYLRHPKSFLAEEYVLGSGPDRPFNEWLEAFLGEWASGEVDNRVRWAKLASEIGSVGGALEGTREALVQNTGLLNDFQSNWDAYVKSIYPRYLAGKNSSATILPVLQKFGISISDIRDAVQDEIESAWESCFESASESSTWVLLNSNELAGEATLRLRNIPPILIEDFPKVAEYSKGMSAPKNIAGGTLRKMYNDIRTGIRDSSEQQYITFIMRGLFFGAMGYWRVATIMASQALQLSSDGSAPRITGREASYLKGVAQRNSARYLRDIDKASISIDHAVNLLGPNGNAGGKVRFAAEKISIEVARQCFNSFDGKDKASSPPSLISWHNRIHGEYVSFFRDHSVCQPEWVRQQAYKSMYGSFLMVKIFKAHLDQIALDESDNGLIQIALQELRPYFTKDHRESQTHLANIVYFAGVKQFARDSDLVEEAENILARLLSIAQTENHEVMPYDKARFEFFRQTCLY